MKASGSLTNPEQKHALESTYTFFKGVTPFLRSMEERLQPEEKLQAENLCDLAQLCEHKLIEAFPGLLEWLREWEGRGK